MNVWEIFWTSVIFVLLLVLFVSLIYQFFASIIFTAMKRHSIWKSDGSMAQEIVSAQREKDRLAREKRERREAKIAKLQNKI